MSRLSIVAVVRHWSGNVPSSPCVCEREKTAPCHVLVRRAKARAFLRTDGEGSCLKHHRSFADMTWGDLRPPALDDWVSCSTSGIGMFPQSVFYSLLRESIRRLGAAVPAHVRIVRLRGLLALRPSLDSLATAVEHVLNPSPHTRVRTPDMRASVMNDITIP